MAKGKKKPALSQKAAEVFTRDAEKALTALENIINKGEPYDRADLRNYVIYAHGMRGALANIGMTELSDIALKLEKSGRSGDAAVITSETPLFVSLLRDFLADIRAEEPGAVLPEGAEAVVNMDYLRGKLIVIKQACVNFDAAAADDALTELRNMVWPPPVKDMLYKISQYLLHSDFTEITDTIDKYLA